MVGCTTGSKTNYYSNYYSNTTTTNIQQPKPREVTIVKYDSPDYREYNDPDDQSDLRRRINRTYRKYNQMPYYSNERLNYDTQLAYLNAY